MDKKEKLAEIERVMSSAKEYELEKLSFDAVLALSLILTENDDEKFKEFVLTLEQLTTQE